MPAISELSTTLEPTTSVTQSETVQPNTETTFGKKGVWTVIGRGDDAALEAHVNVAAAFAGRALDDAGDALLAVDGVVQDGDLTAFLKVTALAEQVVGGFSDGRHGQSLAKHFVSDFFLHGLRVCCATYSSQRESLK